MDIASQLPHLRSLSIRRGDLLETDLVPSSTWLLYAQPVSPSASSPPDTTSYPRGASGCSHRCFCTYRTAYPLPAPIDRPFRGDKARDGDPIFLSDYGTVSSSACSARGTTPLLLEGGNDTVVGTSPLIPARPSHLLSIQPSSASSAYYHRTVVSLCSPDPVSRAIPPQRDSARCHLSKPNSLPATSWRSPLGLCRAS